jgi:dihydrofolate synthase/folylpolyglutamate synthase
MTDAYQDCLDFLYGRLNYERVGMPRTAELRLGRMRRLLRALGDPQDALRIIHIAGTKGKGSTAAMLAAALSASGRRTGLFCSPHLHRLEERFRVDDREASPGELIALTEAVRPAVERLDASDPLRGPTFFEITTAMGLLHFARSQTETVVLEVGMGGRLDSTNAIRPVVSVVTSISFDHTRQLGHTLGAIAREKAGIIKRGRPVISGVVQSEPREVVLSVARARRCPIRQLGEGFSFEYRAPSQPILRPDPGRVAVRTWLRDWPELALPLPGPHQAHNAAVALATLDVLAERAIETSADSVAKGFAALRFPARVELLGESPWLVIDGAHNVASAEALAETLRACLPDVPRTLVFGTTREKDLRGQLRVLLPLFAHCVATQYRENPRAVLPEEVARAAREIQPACQVTIEPGPAEALDAARRLTPREGLICVAGSLFLAAETRAIVLGIRAPTVSTLAAP